MTISKPKICPYCGNTVRPLDKHVITITPDSDTPTQIVVSCVLVRYYSVNPIDQN